MDKKSLMVLMLLLSGCNSKTRLAACVFNNGNNTIEVELSSEYDDLKNINVKKTYTIPYRYSMDERIISELKKQLEENCCLEDNVIFCEYEIIPQDKYSFSRTVEYLELNSYACR